MPYGLRAGKRPYVDYLYSLRVAGPSPRRGVRNFNVLYADAGLLTRTFDVEELLGAFDDHIPLHVAASARTRVFVHAGAVGWKGRAIVVPGESRSGKTSLVAALVEAGATYYSDEYALLDDRGRVHPYLAPLSVRDGDGSGAQLLTPEELGGKSGKTPIPVGAVVVTRYREGARWRPRRISPGRGVLELLGNTVPARIRPAAVMPVLRQVASEAEVLKGVRGEAGPVAEGILERLG